METIRAPRKPWLAALMSFVLPGFGQLYNGQVNRALWLFMIFALLTYPMAALVALYLPPVLTAPILAASLVATILLWLYGMRDAWRSARDQPDYVVRPWQLSGVYMAVLVLCDGVALPALTTYFRSQQVEAFRVPSASMEPSVLQGDFFFADKRYNCPNCKSGIRRGDVAVFAYQNDRTQVYVKRIIGLPGDHVQLRGRDISVNGRALDRSASGDTGGVRGEAYGDRHWQVRWSGPDAAPSGQAWTVPPGQVFVLGDNRGNSVDSRVFGTVPMQDVLGKARQVWL